MNTDLKSYIQSLAVEQLLHTKAGAMLEEAVNILNTAQVYSEALQEKKNEAGVTGIKAVTLATFSILQHIAAGKAPSDFTENDWKEIAGFVAENTVLSNGTSYSILIFSYYERYIRFSAEQIQEIALPEAIAAIQLVADELHMKIEILHMGTDAEAQITVDCLWLCLEAMIKLLACTASLTGSQDNARLAQAVAAFGFEYGRLTLFQREQAIVSELIDAQYQLDAALDAKYHCFLNELTHETEQFYSLIENAFAADFRQAFLQSALLAKRAGVDEEEILQTTDDIDAFFLD